jgi:hypothetical protein
MLQTRTRTLDGTLRKKFQQWYPGGLVAQSLLGIHHGNPMW